MLAKFREMLGPRPLVTLALLLLAVAAASIWFFNSRPAVETTLVARGKAAQVVYATGVVEPLVWAKVAALQRKRIVEICSCEGQTVKMGEVLARLDDVEEKAVLNELRARRDRIQDEVERTRGLVERNVASRVALEEKQTQLREYEARIQAQQERIDHLVLRAPMDGVVLRRDGQVGEIAGITSSDVLLWVGQPRPLRIVADINEEDIVKVRPGQKVLLRHESQSGDPLSATVDSVTPKGDPATKTFRSYFLLPAETPLKIGMSVEANIIVREVDDALLVPAQAVVDGQVWIVESNRVRLRKVRLGITGARMVEVLEGIEEGQRVVSPARSELTPGARVKLRPGKQP
jgi:membrane fusion protein (multidrug efflux system)